MLAETDLTRFQREADQIREVVDAKMGSVWTAINGIHSVLERITTSVEKQAEQNTHLALMGNTLQHFQEIFVEHREATTEKLSDHERRLSALEKKDQVKEWTRKGVWAVIGLAVAGALSFLTTNFDKIAMLLGAG